MRWFGTINATKTASGCYQVRCGTCQKSSYAALTIKQESELYTHFVERGWIIERKIDWGNRCPACVEKENVAPIAASAEPPTAHEVDELIMLNRGAAPVADPPQPQLAVYQQYGEYLLSLPAAARMNEIKKLIAAAGLVEMSRVSLDQAWQAADEHERNAFFGSLMVERVGEQPTSAKQLGMREFVEWLVNGNLHGDNRSFIINRKFTFAFSLDQAWRAADKDKQRAFAEVIIEAHRQLLIKEELNEARAPGARREWTDNEVRLLESLAKSKTPAPAIAVALNRSHGAVRQKALVLGLSLNSRGASSPRKEAPVVDEPYRSMPTDRRNTVPTFVDVVEPSIDEPAEWWKQMQDA